MSTRCHIKIVKNDYEPAYVYHHWDGYPEGVGAELITFLNPSKSSIYNAQTPLDLAESIEMEDDYYNVDDGIHGDEEYLYLIDMDKRKCECFSMDWQADEATTFSKPSIFDFEYGIPIEDFAFYEIKNAIGNVIKKYNLQKDKDVLNKVKNKILNDTIFKPIAEDIG